MDIIKFKYSRIDHILDRNNYSKNKVNKYVYYSIKKKNIFVVKINYKR
jgi:hypothetical protein